MMGRDYMGFYADEEHRSATEAAPSPTAKPKPLKKVAREAAAMLLEAGERQKKWTPEMKASWTRAFNALQRLSGHKIRL
jgi:hypothetical protein